MRPVVVRPATNLGLFKRCDPRKPAKPVRFTSIFDFALAACLHLCRVGAGRAAAAGRAEPASSPGRQCTGKTRGNRWSECATSVCGVSRTASGQPSHLQPPPLDFEEAARAWWLRARGALPHVALMHTPRLVSWWRRISLFVQARRDTARSARSGSTAWN